MSRRLVFRIAIAVALFVVLIFVLLRSCLSSFDERAAVGGGGSSQSASQFLVFEKDGKGVIFSLIKYDKTISYKKVGGIINKQINTTYYAQANDLTTVAKTSTQKVKNHGQIKSYPVEIIGASGNKAWLFAGELMAYDPFTLTKEADVTILEEKNPVLKGKLINERQYYDFDNNTHQIIFTATDGSKYSLNTTTLIATAMEDDKNPLTTADTRIKELDQLTSQIKEQQNAAYDRLRENNRLFGEKQITLNQYKDSSRIIKEETDRLGKQFDSLRLLAREAKDFQSSTETNSRKLNARKAGYGFGGMRVNCDTLDGQWYGLFTGEEIIQVNPKFDYRTINDDDARNKLFTAALTQKNNNWIIGDEKKKTGDAVYLQGGFLLSRETDLPFHIPDGFLIVHKDIIGNEGKVQLTRININGKQLWTIHTSLKEFYDWQQHGQQLVITGTDNKKLSFGRVNLLQVINLQNGTVAAYDFFEDKVRK